MKAFVTGGAGFIGSHVVDYLLAHKHQVVIYDNFSTGKEMFIAHHHANPALTVVRGDLLDNSLLEKSFFGSDFVFHFAAHADVRTGFTDHFIDHQQNLVATHNLLEAMTKNHISRIAFASTSSVYGDATIHPTPEDYPHHPTSLYGATKSADESYIHAYASYFDWDAYIYRFVSWIGERYTHGIIFDLLKKLQTRPSVLELLSDGSPKKSSLYVKDGISAIFKVIRRSPDKINIFNLGHDEILTVDEIVDTILRASHVKVVKKYLGGDRGWKGDNNFVLLRNTKLKALGWKPTTSFRAGIIKTVLYLLQHPELLE